MDATRLSETLGWLRADEQSNKIQAKLVAVQAALQNLTGNPGDQNFQKQLNDSLTELGNTLQKTAKKYSPAEADRIEEIGGNPFFTENMSDRIKAEISNNPMTPTIVLQDVNEIVRSREEYVKKIQDTERGIDDLIGYTDQVETGEAAIGFEIPRSLFDNEFRDFISELRAIQRIVRVCAEVETGSPPEIKLGQLSSTDPLIFLNTPPAVVASIAFSVSWVLNQWKKFEEIRKVRAETAKLKEFDNSELENFFDKKITDSLDKAVAEKVAEMMSSSKLDETRKAELDSELAWALKALFARIERGMRVEVVASLLKKPDEGELSDEQKQKQDALGSVQKLASQLAFPRVDAEPILSLPRMSEQDGQSRTGRSSRAQ